MARLSATELEQYIDDSLDQSLPSGNALNMAQMRQAISATIKESLRQLPNTSECSGTMYLIGSDPANLFDMTLLEEGEVGGLILDGVETGYQLVPLVTGSGINQGNPNSGVSIPSEPFDGLNEISSGTGPTENMLCIDYNGYIDLVSSLKPAPTGSQANREVEIDIMVFDGSGTPLREIGFVASANQSTGGRAFTQNVARVTLSPDFLAAGEHVGLVIRKFAGEAPTTVRITKGFLQVTLNSLGA